MNRGDLRNAARAALPKGAFLRRDRGEALFVTDAPRLSPDGPWRSALPAAGFLTRERDGLLWLIPGPEWLTRLEEAHPAPPDEFCQGFARFSGREIEPESLALFALGARVLDGGANDGRFDKRLRQRAAECLRIHPNPIHPGGGLYACALLTHLIKEART